jgi:hypothetical protein
LKKKLQSVAIFKKTPIFVLRSENFTVSGLQKNTEPACCCMKIESINSSIAALLFLLFTTIAAEQLLFSPGRNYSISYLKSFTDCINANDAKTSVALVQYFQYIKKYSQPFNCQNENYEKNCKLKKAILYEWPSQKNLFRCCGLAASVTIDI